MSVDGGPVVDRAVIIALFADFDEDTGRVLLDAVENDIAEWSDKLIDAWAAGDADACQRARHSLKGICANFGASALLAMSAGDLSSPAARDQLRACSTSTILALREAAGG